MSAELPQHIRNTEGKFGSVAGEFRQGQQRTDAGTVQARQQVENPPAELDRQVAEHFRSGQGGAELQTLQQAVDSGAASWPQLARGQGDPTLVGLFKSTINANFAICQELAAAYRSGGDTDAIMRNSW
jgi:hypothetical protein